MSLAATKGLKPRTCKNYLFARQVHASDDVAVAMVAEADLDDERAIVGCAGVRITHVPVLFDFVVDDEKVLVPLRVRGDSAVREPLLVVFARAEPSGVSAAIRHRDDALDLADRQD